MSPSIPPNAWARARGLGLSTAYGIVKQTGGFIFCDSTPGEGTTFSIYLPALDPAEAAAETRALSARPGPPKDLSGRGVILLVEDEAPVRSFAARALQLRGYSVLEAESGEEALEILEDDTAHVDLFISDVIMPGLDGPSWVREARKTRPEIPTIFVSGYAEDHFKNADGDLDDTIFIPNPSPCPTYRKKVKELLSPEG